MGVSTKIEGRGILLLPAFEMIQFLNVIPVGLLGR